MYFQRIALTFSKLFPSHIIHVQCHLCIGKVFAQICPVTVLFVSFFIYVDRAETAITCAVFGRNHYCTETTQIQCSIRQSVVSLHDQVTEIAYIGNHHTFRFRFGEQGSELYFGSHILIFLLPRIVATVPSDVKFVQVSIILCLGNRSRCITCYRSSIFRAFPASFINVRNLISVFLAIATTHSQRRQKPQCHIFPIFCIHYF